MTKRSDSTWINSYNHSSIVVILPLAGIDIIMSSRYLNSLTIPRCQSPSLLQLSPLFVKNRTLFPRFHAGICAMLSGGHLGARRSGNPLGRFEDSRLYALTLLSCHTWQIAEGLWYPRFLPGPGDRLAGSSPIVWAGSRHALADAVTPAHHLPFRST